MSDNEVVSTITRPPEKMVQRFKVWEVKDHTVRTYLEKSYSLGICCQHCPRLIEWTPFDLEERFSNNLDVRLDRIVPRLSCTGEGGCGSKEIAVFPHLFDGEWTWPHPEEPTDD